MIELSQGEELRVLKSVYVLQGAQIDFYWDQIKEGFGEVPGFYEFYTPEWVYGQLKSGLFQVWALSDGIIRGIVLTQIQALPRQNTFEILGAFGIDMLLFFDEMRDVFFRFARQNGCDTMLARCRPGLARKLRSYHPKAEYIVLSYPVPQLEDN